MTTKLLALFSLIFAGTALQAQYVSLSQKEISKLQQQLSADPEVKKLYDKFQRTAAQALTEAPQPIDTIRTEGLLQGHPKKTATALALRDIPKIYALALVYRVNHDKQYLQQAGTFLKAWATYNIPNGDPIDDTNLDGAIEAYDLLKEALPPADAAIIRKWLQQTAEAEINGPSNRPARSTSYNNWHSHRLKIIGEIGYAIGDTALQTYTIEGLKKQVERNLNADGSSIDFQSRDALHYHVYDLEPLLKLSILLQRATGVNYYTYQSPTTSSIQKSVDWVLPYVSGGKTHPEFVLSTVKFDKERANNHEAGYQPGTLFNPRNGLSTLLLADYFDPNMLPAAQKLLGTDSPYPSWQSVLNALKK
jgi:hypothetical protein